MGGYVAEQGSHNVGATTSLVEDAWSLSHTHREEDSLRSL